MLWRYGLIAASVSVLLASLWLWSRQDTPSPPPSASVTGRILYYQDPSGEPVYSATPKKDEQGREFVAIREVVTAQAPDGRKVLYYRNPMGLPDTSPTPKKDSMGMDYVPVYEGDSDATAIKLTPDLVHKLGAKLDRVRKSELEETILLTASASIDERRLSLVSLKFPANITKLYRAAAGETVKAGDPMFELYSPFLLQQEVDLSIALRAQDTARDIGQEVERGNTRSRQVVRERLRLLEVPESEIERLIASKDPSGHLTWRAPHNGTILEKSVIAGMRAEEGMTLYRLADLSRIWVLADVPEFALSKLKVGMTASVKFNAHPSRKFEGKVALIIPEMMLATRSAKARIELDNRDGAIFPGMSAAVEIRAAASTPMLTAALSSIIDSGSEQHVIIARSDGSYAPQKVQVGRRNKDRVEIVSGLKEGDTVLTSATFLIDSESNLRAALQSVQQGTKP